MQRVIHRVPIALALVALAFTFIATAHASAKGAFSWLNAAKLKPMGTFNADPGKPTQKFGIPLGSGSPAFTIACNQMSGGAVGGVGSATSSSTLAFFLNKLADSNPKGCFVEGVGSYATVTTPAFPCYVTYHSGTAVTGKFETVNGTVDMSCPAGETGITFDIPGLCKITLKNNYATSAGPVSYRTNATKPLSVTAEAKVTTGLKYSTTGLCGTGTYEDGTYSGSTVLNGLDEEGQPTSLFVF